MIGSIAETNPATVFAVVDYSSAGGVSAGT